MARQLTRFSIILAVLSLLILPGAPVSALEKNPNPNIKATILADGEYYPALLEKIRNAEATIDLAMFVFKTTKSSQNRPSKIVQELKAAVQRSVKVRAFLEKSGHDTKLNDTNQKTARLLREHGIKVFFDSEKVTTHTKVIVIDSRYSILGSHNFTHSALKYNHELSLLVDSPKLAAELTDYMNKLKGER